MQEVLELAKGQVLVNIEIKNPTHGQYPITELADQALKEVKNAGMIDRVIFSSFNPASLEWIKKKRTPGLGRPALPPTLEFLPEVTGGKAYSVLNLRNSYLTQRKNRQNPQGRDKGQRLYSEFRRGVGTVRQVGGRRDHHQSSGSADQILKKKSVIHLAKGDPLNCPYPDLRGHSNAF